MAKSKVAEHVVEPVEVSTPAQPDHIGELLAGGKLVRASQLSPSVVCWKPDMDTPLGQCPTNLDLSTWQGKQRVLKAASPGEYDFSEHGTMGILATHFVVIPDESADPETGEVRTFCRTILFDRDGKHARTTAYHAPGRMKAVLDLFGPEAWKDGIPFIITLRRSPKTGRTYHDIQVADR